MVPKHFAAPRPGGTFNTYNTQNLGSLDPQVSSAASGAISRSSLDQFPLPVQDRSDPATYLNWEPEPDLAASVESPDGSHLDDQAAAQRPLSRRATGQRSRRRSRGRQGDLPAGFQPDGQPNRGIIGAIDPAQIEMPAPDTVVFKLRYAYGPFH